MKASSITNSAPVKFLYIGASGAGKTGSLISLLRAGYSIGLLDMDGEGYIPLTELCKKENPEYLDRLDIVSLRDKVKVSGTSVSVPAPKAYIKAVETMSKWDDGTIPAEWGTKKILVLDSLTMLGRAAFYWAQGLNRTAKDPRQWYGAAQESLKMLLEMLTSPDFNTNVIVISHIQFYEIEEGVTRGYASSIGKALGPELPKIFNTMIQAESKGSGEKVSRTISTVPSATVDLKTPIPWKLDRSLPLDTGLATLFEKLQPSAGNAK